MKIYKNRVETKKVPKPLSGVQERHSSSYHQGCPHRSNHECCEDTLSRRVLIKEPFCRASFKDVQTATEDRRLHSFVNGKRESFRLFGT